MSNLQDHTIIDALPVNEDAFTAINAEITANRGKEIPQPILIVGQEGMGKTTLLRRIHDDENHASRHKIWIDGRTVFSADDIIGRVEISNDTILFIDDLDYFFTRCTYDEQYRLRNFLYNEGAPMLIATISRILPALTDYKAPFFEGLKIVYLSTKEVERLIPHIFGELSGRAHKMLDYLPSSVQSLATIHHILASGESSDRDMTALTSLYDGKYRNIYQNLPVNSQHILNVLAQDKSGLLFADIREKTGLATGSLTPYLKSLDAAGLIGIDRSVRKKTRYSLADPLMRLWLNS